MSRGYVYILTNEAMPGLVKIGKTTRSVEQRAAELTHTGIPFPFDVAFQVLSPDCSELEQWVHAQLSDCRVNAQREFFLCDVDKAERVVEQAHHEQISSWLHEYMPSHMMVEEEYYLDPSFPMIMSTHLEMPAEDVVQAYGYLMPEDMQAAVKRKFEHCTGVKKMDWLQCVDGYGSAPE